MPTDRHGLNLSTASDAARDAYVAGCDALLTLYPGEIERFDRAIAADPGFALAHAGRARALQMKGDLPSARAAIAQAEALSAGLPARERSQVEVFRLLLAGQGAAALAAVRTHLAEWPRDAMVLGTNASQLGLMGLSGRPGREHELAAFLGSLAPHYGDDWWFGAHYGMALSEVGEHRAARPLIERSLTENPANAYVGHAVAHLHYEEGEPAAAIDFMRAWLPTYPRAGGLHGHLSWHLALSELAVGNIDAGLQLYSDAFAAEDYASMALIKVIDATSFLWRAELAGHERDPARWQAIHAFARKMFPNPAMAYLDWHVALAEAVAGDGAALEERLRAIEELERGGRYPAGSMLPALARAFAAFARQDYAVAIEGIEPLLAERERIGGSRAQIDLVEFTLMRAYVEAGRQDKLRELVRQRRVTAGDIPSRGCRSRGSIIAASVVSRMRLACELPSLHGRAAASAQTSEVRHRSGCVALQQLQAQEPCASVHSGRKPGLAAAASLNRSFGSAATGTPYTGRRRRCCLRRPWSCRAR